jgi:hypothetical protein
MAVLLSSLAYSEFPELVSLLDNTSNDFTTQSCPAEVVIVTAIPVTAKTPGSRVMPSAEISDVQKQTNVFCTSRDLLLIYSILRT